MSTTPQLRVFVEYCGMCGFESRYEQLKSALEAKFGESILVSGANGRRGSFEITVGTSEADRTLLYSMIASKEFPAPDGVIAAIEQFTKDGTVLPIAAAQGGCVLQ